MNELPGIEEDNGEYDYENEGFENDSDGEEDLNKLDKDALEKKITELE